MDYIHYIIVIPLILLIVYFQVKVLIQANRKIDLFKAIFPDSKQSYSISKANIVISETVDNDDDLPADDSDDIWVDDEEDGKRKILREVEVSQISVQGDNATMDSIKDALNMYLQKNSGAVSDFALMKDVVERYSGAEEEEITVMQPIPLYMGLMGTMIGIIVGISVIAANGGVEELTNVSSMMSCVAIAMAASLVGIIFTTIISWKSKGAKTLVETRKNIFYSWLQTELLPVLSGNTVTALSLLQANLMTFNQTFKGNIQEFDSVLSNVRQVSRDQADALNAISRIDINRVAQANVTVLRELERCTAQIDRFNQYLINVNGYLDAVNALNSNLDRHLDRTAAVERMGAFFEREMQQVQNREEYIRQVVGSVDSTLEESFNQMSSSMNTYLEELRGRTTSDLDTLRQAYEQNQRAFVAKLAEQQEALSKKTDELDKVLQGIQSLSETKTAISSLASISRENSRRLDQIVDAIRGSNTEQPIRYVEAHAGTSDDGMPKRIRRISIAGILNVSVKIAAIIACILFVIDFITRLLAQ